VLDRLLALLLAALPVAAAAQDEETYGERPHGGSLNLVAWGGGLLDLGGRYPGAAMYGGELSYSFEAVDLGVMAQSYNLGGPRADTAWSPILLGRFEQRFETRRGVEAVLALGIGAARIKGWQAWYQLAFGLRLGLGRLFLAGEVGFEQLSLFRLAGGVGVRL